MLLYMVNLIIIIIFIIFIWILIINFNTNKTKTITKSNLLVNGIIDNNSSEMLISTKYGFIFNYNNNYSYLLSDNVDFNNISVLDTTSSTIKKLVLLNNNLIINQNFLYNNKKLVIFIRHARSISNDTRNFLIRNPDLCQQGYEQTKVLASKILNLNNYLKSNTLFTKGIELAIISPLKRTLLTAIPTLEILPNINVESSFLCTESAFSPSKLAFSPSNVGFLTVDEFQKFNNSITSKNIKVNNDEYNKWSKLIWGNNINDTVLIHDRIKLFNEFIKSKNEKVIIVFSHGDFLRQYFNYILNDNIDYKLYLENTHFISMYHD